MKIIAQYETRVDKLLQNELQISRNQISHFIKTHSVTINSKSVNKCGYIIKVGDIIEFEFPKPTKLESYKLDIDFNIETIYEDDDLLIINKPPFLVVHPAPSVKEPTLVDWLKDKGITLSTISGEYRNGIVHRIDKNTSGALVIAKNNFTHQALSSQLENRSMGRYYLALIDLPLKESLIIDKPIARDQKNRIKMSTKYGGKDAKSAFLKLLGSKNADYELIAAKLFSGRTHQIRVHLKSISRHILGDTLYGFKSKKGKINRTMLHAYIIYFIHPRTKEAIFKQAPLFDDFKDVLSKYFEMEALDEKIAPKSLLNSFNTLF